MCLSIIHLILLTLGHCEWQGLATPCIKKTLYVVNAMLPHQNLALETLLVANATASTMESWLKGALDAMAWQPTIH